MTPHRQTRIDRRLFHRLCLTVPAPVIAAAWGYRAIGAAQDDATPDPTASADATRDTILPATPACDDGDDEPTEEQTEGPFYTPDSPERTDLREAGMPGTPLTVAGYVLTTDCRPVAGALVDFWQADDAGVYDNEGFTLRGHQFADDEGRFYLETILPGLYPGRTRHIHVKVQAPDRPVLTTQIYFPDLEQNEQDGIFDESLVMDLEEDDAETLIGLFTFVLDVTESAQP